MLAEARGSRSLTGSGRGEYDPASVNRRIAMPAFQKETTVNAPVETVFSYLADFSRHREWTQHPVQIEQTTPGSVGAGTTFTSRNRFLGRELADRLKVTEFAPNERLVYEADGDTGGFRHIFRVAPANGGTRVTKGIETLRQTLIGRLLAPLFLIVAPRALAGDLERIKGRLEA
jgi:uncharacterized protein YndB with AHSA1/START domain